MTDTRILDGMMRTLARNPLVKGRLEIPIGPGTANDVNAQFIETDEKPFYAKREAIESKEMNKRYAERVDLFHQSVSEVRLERPRRGDCPQVRTIEKHMDGQVWTRTEKCPGPVHAVETRINGAIRVDGKCLTCGWDLHRAGLLKG